MRIVTTKGNGGMVRLVGEAKGLIIRMDCIMKGILSMRKRMGMEEWCLLMGMCMRGRFIMGCMKVKESIRLRMGASIKDRGRIQ